MRKGQRLNPATRRGQYNTYAAQRKRKERSEKKYIGHKNAHRELQGKEERRSTLRSLSLLTCSYVSLNIFTDYLQNEKVCAII